MKNRKLLVLASLLSLGLFAGCAGKKSNTSTNSQEVTSVASETKDSSNASETNVSSEEDSEEATSSAKATIKVTGVTISGACETLEADEELQLSAKVEATGGNDTLGVTWKSSNENVATVDETGKVKALSVSADTEVTITATSKKDASVSQSVTITVLKNENISLFGDKGNMTNGDQAAAVASPGTLVEWHDQNWCGGVTTINKAEKEGNAFEIDYTETTGSQWFGTQVFYKNSSLTEGTPYKLSLKVNASVGGSITINGKVVTLVKGDNNVDVKYIESATGASLSMQFGVDGVGPVLAMDAKVEVVGWTDITDDKVALAAPTNVAVAAGESQGLYTLSFDAVDHAAGYMYSVKNADDTEITALSYKACESGSVIDLREYDTASYKVVVQAVGDGLEYSDSATSDPVTINHEKPAERTAVTYHADYGDEVIDLAFGEAANAGTTPTYWNDQNWCGSVTNVDYAMAKGDQIQFKFSGATIAYGFQLFGTNANVITGSKYRLKMNLWSDTAGTVTINGTDVTLAVGDNIINIEYTASSKDEYNNAIGSAINFKNNGIAAATIKMSNIRWTEVISGQEDTDVGETCTEPELLKEIQVVTQISAPEGVVYNTNGTMAWSAVTNAASYNVSVYSDAQCLNVTSIDHKAITNGGALDVSSLEEGTYYAKVYAVASDGTVSEGSSAVTINVSAAGISAPVGVVYNANGTMAWGAVTGADSYKVTVYSDEACTIETSVKDVAIANGGALDVSSLEEGTYYAKVFAVKGDKVSEGSSAVTINVSAAGISAPVGVVYNAGEGTMAWGAVTGADSYKVTVYSDADCTVATEVSDVTLANGGVLDVSSLEAGTYYAKVYAVKGDKVSEGSTAVTITVAATDDGGDEGGDEEEGGDVVTSTDYTATLSSGVGGAWLNLTITFNGNTALTMDDVDLSSAQIVLASGTTLKATGKVGTETIDSKKLKVGIGFPSADFVAEQNHTFTIVITVGGQAYKLTEVFTGKADTTDATFTIISQSIEETTVEEKTEPTVVGNATILATGASDTRFEGAGAFVWIDSASVGYDGTNWASMSATATVEMYDAGGTKTGIVCNNVVLQQPGDGYFCAYVVCSGAPVDGWATTITLTIVVGENAYTCVAQFNGTTYVVAD